MPLKIFVGNRSIDTGHPYFIEPSCHGLPSPHSHMNLTFGSSMHGSSSVHGSGNGQQYRGGSMQTSTCSTGRLMSYPSSVGYAPVGQHLSKIRDGTSTASPYSVNSFTSQPHLLGQVSCLEPDVQNFRNNIEFPIAIQVTL